MFTERVWEAPPVSEACVRHFLTRQSAWIPTRRDLAPHREDGKLRRWPRTEASHGIRAPSCAMRVASCDGACGLGFQLALLVST